MNIAAQAFPSGMVKKSRPIHDPGANFVVTDVVDPKHEGMTLRDYFAAKALQGLLSDPNVLAPHSVFASKAYEMADAMLVARES